MYLYQSHIKFDNKFETEKGLSKGCSGGVGNRIVSTT